MSAENIFGVSKIINVPWFEEMVLEDLRILFAPSPIFARELVEKAALIFTNAIREVWSHWGINTSILELFEKRKEGHFLD